MKIRKIACIGGGLIGQGWATIFSSKGYEVTIMDLDKRILENDLSKIKSNLRFLEENHLLNRY